MSEFVTEGQREAQKHYFLEKNENEQKGDLPLLFQKGGGGGAKDQIIQNGGNL